VTRHAVSGQASQAACKPVQPCSWQPGHASLCPAQLESPSPFSTPRPRDPRTRAPPDANQWDDFDLPLAWKGGCFMMTVTAAPQRYLVPHQGRGHRETAGKGQGGQGNTGRRRLSHARRALHLDVGSHASPSLEGRVQARRDRVRVAAEMMAAHAEATITTTTTITYAAHATTASNTWAGRRWRTCAQAPRHATPLLSIATATTIVVASPRCMLHATQGACVTARVTACGTVCVTA